MAKNDKDKYRELCDQENTIPVFSRFWWLDAVCGSKNWDVALIFDKGGQIVASLPYYIEKKYGFTRLSMPKLTQKLGPWIKYPEGQKYESKLGYEHKILDELIDKLPKFDEFHQKFDYKHTNWLPFYWRDFEQTVFYTYRINNLANLTETYDNFRGNIKREIKKAIKKGIEVKETEDVEHFFNINKMTFARQEKSIPYSLDFLKRLDKAIGPNRKIYVAKDKDDETHAAIYIIWDKNCAYYLMGGGNPDLRNSGATSLIMWTAIQEMANIVDSFDFEGSMIKPIERYFRAFGSEQTPYYGLRKVRSRRLKAYYFIKSFLAR